EYGVEAVLEPVRIGLDRGPAGRTPGQVDLHRHHPGRVEPTPLVLLEHLRMYVPAHRSLLRVHVSNSRSLARARIKRVLAVPSGTPSSCAASRTVNPSIAVVWMTAR